jgi:two-component system cell cycle sensor histidine kinase/response regulator CckA
MARILIVEDGEQNRYLLEVLLQQHGHEVAVAANGAEALEAARAAPPDLAISDLLMPVMDGFTLCRKWKADDRLCAAPFIVYTATYTEPKDEEFVLSLGADRFVRKPEEPEALMRIVDEVLAAARAGSPAGSAAAAGAAQLERYSEVLFRKLEKKVAELAAQNRKLAETVAERVRGEEALRVSEAEYRIVADNTYNWEFWLDPDRRFRYISPSCRRITGRECGEFTGDAAMLERIIHPDDQALYQAHVDGIERLKGESNVEFRILHADGSHRWIAHDCMPVYDRDGNWLGTRGSNRDITEQKRLEAQLRHAQRMEAVGQLAGGVAHDFNNILTAILGYTNLLQAKTGVEDPRRAHLDEIAAAAERASSLTASLLTFSRKREITLRTIELNGLIRNLEKFLRRIIGEDIEVRMKLASGDIAIHADAGQLEQVLMNLATNARDAMPKGGILFIETDLVAIDNSFIRMHGYGTPGRFAMVSVTDTGGGMDEKTREHIFEPFFTTKEPGKGTGLGLSIVYGIVKQHKGYINVYSEPGRGSTFRLLFQAVAPEPAASEAKDGAPADDEPPGGKTILVVDDDAAIRQLLEIYLVDLGFTVFQAEDGQDGLEKVRGMAGAIDLVVMDTIMPRMNGREAALEMRMVRPDLKIMLTSGYPEDIAHGRGVPGEGIEFMLKPLRPTEFAARVKKLLRGA